MELGQYNDKFIERLKNRDIKEKTKENKGTNIKRK